MENPILDTLKRRSRFTRSPRSAMLRLSPRDVAILLALYRYRYLRSTHIHELVSGSATTLRWRLRELFDAGLVARPLRQWEAIDALYVPVVYELTVKGLRRLQDLGVLSARAALHGGPTSESHFRHSLMVCETMCDLEVEVRHTAGLAYIGEDEILERLAGIPIEHLNGRAMPIGRNRFVIPDGLFGIRSPKGVILCALELDRGHEPLSRRGMGSSYKEKFALYHELIANGRYRDLLSTPAPLLVLHLTTTESRVRTMAKFAGADHFHLFRTLAKSHFIADPWLRPDGSHFSLATASTLRG
jgi:hypothetical protein